VDNKIILGCIADDFTGASDAASFLVAGGLRTVLFNGIPASLFNFPDNVQAVVIALKTRTQETVSAVNDSLAALQWFLNKKAEHIYIKYCSTFDSTPQGNIGPICDAAMEKMDVPYTLLCPSLPVNKRTVNSGHLYVDGIPLERTHMSRHPLTPMWDNYIPELMRNQSKYPCHIITKDVLHDRINLRETITAYQKQYKHFYLVPDYETEDDAKSIAALFGGLQLLTGGSGLMFELGKKYGPGSRNDTASALCGGKAIIFAGSCSMATKTQVGYFLKNTGNGIMIDPEKLLHGEQTVDTIWSEINSIDTEHILLYSTGSTSKDNKNINKEGALVLELTMAELARLAIHCGYERIIAAGGETSGAITKALQFDAYEIGESIAPGVPLMIPLCAKNIRLVLKSGNFGQEDFFARALLVTRGNA
jgi:uncharacterized protein YgbK (DUF1537 family)